MSSRSTLAETKSSASVGLNPLFLLKNQQKRVKEAYYGKCRIAMWPQYRLLYLRLPKCGNSSVIAALAKPELKRLQPGVLSNRFEDWTTFTFVRNPWSRLVSTYRQKAATGATTSRFENGIYEGFRQKNIPVYPGISFSEFCELACSFPDEVTDKHLQSQSHILMHNGKPVIKSVCRFENMSEDWRGIVESTGISAQLPQLNVSSGRHVHYRDYYQDRRLVNLVGDRYAADVTNFSYFF